MIDKDPFDFDDEEEETEQAPKVDQREVEELRAFKTQADAERRENAIADVFKEAGVSPRAAKLWASLNPDAEATPEAVKAFAQEYSIGPEPEPNRGFTPTVIESGQPPAAKTFTRKELEDIARINPQRARALAESGRVRWNNPDIQGRPQK
jgi:hypothetical protein